METQPMKSKKIILIRSLFTVLFCLSAVMLFGQQNTEGKTDSTSWRTTYRSENSDRCCP